MSEYCKNCEKLQDQINELETITTAKYKRALDEIEEKLGELITETPEYDNCYYKDQCGEYCPPKREMKVATCLYEEVDKILDIISRVKGEVQNENT